MATFEVSVVEIYIAGEKVGEFEEVTVDEIKALARDRGIKKFTVEDETGRELDVSDFPVTGDRKLTIRPYYEAK
jgi:hypothetical protein